MPFGPPKLIVTMCTPETQAKYHEQPVWDHKDKSTGTDSQQKAESRKDIEYHERMPGADQWERGGELYEFVSAQRTHTHTQFCHATCANVNHSLICSVSLVTRVGVGAGRQERGSGEAGRYSQSTQG